jgi:hypothetical protein
MKVFQAAINSFLYNFVTNKIQPENKHDHIFVIAPTHSFYENQMNTHHAVENQ